MKLNERRILYLGISREVIDGGYKIESEVNGRIFPFYLLSNSAEVEQGWFPHRKSRLEAVMVWSRVSEPWGIKSFKEDLYAGGWPVMLSQGLSGVRIAPKLGYGVLSEWCESIGRGWPCERGWKSGIYIGEKVIAVSDCEF